MLPQVDGTRNEPEIKRLRRLFANLAKIPQHRREDECADVRMIDILRLLREAGDDCSDLRVTQILPPYLSTDHL